jgi:hypothetical protein
MTSSPPTNTNKRQVLLPWHFFLLAPTLELFFYFAAYESTNYLAHRMKLVYSRGVQWGIAAEMYAIAYVVVILTLNIATRFLQQRLLLLCVIAAAVFTLLILPDIRYYPYRIGTLMGIGIIGIFINFFLAMRYRSRPGPALGPA